MKPAALFVALALALPSVAAADQLTEAQLAQLEALRGEVAGEIQLQAFDLLDELVYQWIESPPFKGETPVVLADVSVPVGFGSGLEALVENHFTNLLVKNPRTHLVLTHCPGCTAVVVHSGKSGTVVSRGVDQPETLAKAGAATGSRHAIFLDFEAEGVELVLRARITSLEPNLPIVYARTLTTRTTSPALLRDPDQLKSAEQARQEYLDALRGRGVTVVPVRIVVRSYASGNNGPSLTSIPFIWLQAGAEIAFTQTRAWTGSLSLGATYLPQLHSGWMAQGRVNRLLTGSMASLTHPDLYMFMGASIMTIRGPAAATFLTNTPTVEQIIASAANNSTDISTTFGAFQFGLELRVKNRLAIGAFIESMPTLNPSDADGPQNLGNYLEFILPFQSVGAEVTFCF